MVDEKGLIKMDRQTKKKILINHQVCENRHYECKSSDLISVRKFGRIILDEEVKMTKKNNFVIKVKIWH